MTSAGSVGGDDRLRLFLALELPAGTLDVLEAWAEAHLRGGRVVPREHLHVTLAFLGSRPARELPAIVGASVADDTPVAVEEERGPAVVRHQDEDGRERRGHSQLHRVRAPECRNHRASEGLGTGAHRQSEIGGQRVDRAALLRDLVMDPCEVGERGAGVGRKAYPLGATTGGDDTQPDADGQCRR